MKRKFLLSVMLILLSVSVFAQEGIKVGFRASPLISFANITDSSKTKVTAFDTKAKLGFSFDFVLTIGFNETIGFATGINIANKGYRGSIPLTTPIGGQSSLEFSQQVTSVEVPIGLKFRSPEIGTGLHIIGMFGVNAEINVANKAITESIVADSSGSLSIKSTETRDNKDINLITASFVPGLGVDWEFDWGMIEMALTYHWGLLNILKRDNKNSDNYAKLNYIALNLGYFF